MVLGGWAVLDLPPILFIKLELYCERFTPLHNSKILFQKISVDLILRFPSLTRSSQRGAQSSILCSNADLIPFPGIFDLLQQYSYDKIFARYFY